MARRNYSQELQDAQRRGAIIVCSIAPYEGMPMAYAPRRSRDPLPWCPADQATPSGSYDGMWRYSGRFCHATWMHYGVSRILCGAREADGVQLTDNIPDVTCPDCRTELHRSV